MIGQTIAHYRIIEKLGAGGMGVVYKAEDTKLGREVALKFPPPRSTQSAEEFQRLIHEARAAASLDHQNICTIHEIGEADGQPYIAMSYVEGKTLRDRLADGPIAISEIVTIAAQVADGLSIAHEKGITHRDIKPENIMINTRGQVKIMDFGLAKSSRQTTKITQEGSTPGTAAYMSPEQAKGDGVDARSDLWSLGVVMYEAITGKLPFEGNHPAAMMYAVLHEPHTSVSGHRLDTPPDLVSLIDRLLRKDPVQRPVGTKAVAAELAQIRDIVTGRASSKPGVRESAQPSLAVLPFANMSTDAENEFFADGLTEDLITAFSKMKELRVVARTSAFQFKGKTTDVRLVGEQLSVGTVLEGSVRKSGNRLRITAQLINVADGFHIWSERYDREMADVFEIQDDIARAIVDALKVKLVGKAIGELVPGGTTNIEAYNLVLRGRHHWNRRSGPELEQAEKCLLEAIALDPGYADAHAWLALVFTTMTDYTGRDAASLCADAIREANVALQLNPDSAEAYLALAMAATNLGNERDAAEAFERTLALNPGHSTGQFWYGFFLANLGRVTEAVQRGERAIQIDPLSTIVHANLSYWYLRAGNPDAAARQLKHAFALDPNFLPTSIYAFVIAEASGRYAEAADHLMRVIATDSERRDLQLDLFRMLYHAGRYEEAVAALEAWLGLDSLSHLRGTFSEAYQRSGIDSVIKLFGESFAEPWLVHRQLGVISLTLLALGYTDRALRWLEYAFDHDRHELLRIRLDHVWDPIRQDPRFIRLASKLDSSTGK